MAAGRAPVAALEPAVHHRAALWAVLTPLLQAVDALGLHPLLDGQLAELADALDVVAETLPAGQRRVHQPGQVAGGRAGRVDPGHRRRRARWPASPPGCSSTRCGCSAGAPAVSVTLPDGAPTAMALLTGSGAADR